MSIQSEIERIERARDDIKYVIAHRYTDVPENAKLEDLAYLVANMQTTSRTRSWQEIQQIVRDGKAKYLFQPGQRFTTKETDAAGKTIYWTVRGHDQHTPADAELTHSMTIEMAHVYTNTSYSVIQIQFDAPEAMYYAETGLEPGTYHFTASNQDWYTSDNGKTFMFTLTQAVPPGGQVTVFGEGMNVPNKSNTLARQVVKTYSSPSSTTLIEEAPITEGNSGTNLGTTNGTGNMNFMGRIMVGSNNYAQSAIRQWLNSSASAGSVWRPQTKFDRPPTWATNTKGFLNALPSDFLEAVQPAIVPCRTNNIYECASLDGTGFYTRTEYTVQDRFFLLSRPEVFGTWDSTDCKDGELLEFYDGLTNVERIKRDNINSTNTARHAWLRSPYPHNTHNERFILNTGAIDNNNANNSYGAAPACIIA